MKPQYPADETRSGYRTTVASAVKTAPKPAVAGIALVVLGIVIVLIAVATVTRSLVPVATLLVMLGGGSVASSAFAGDGLWAKRPDDGDAPPELVQAVGQISAVAGMCAPAVRVIRDSHPDADVGASRGAQRLTVTRGLLDSYTREALIGTVGHEIGHILAGHVPRMRRQLTAVLAPLLLWLGLLMALSLPPVATISPDWMLTTLAPAIAVHLWFATISRQHEFEADLIGARLTGKAAALAAIDHLAAHEDPPQRGSFARVAQLLSTHPSASARRAALETTTGD